MTNVRGETIRGAVKKTVLFAAIALFVSLIIANSVKVGADDKSVVSNEQIIALRTLNKIRTDRGIGTLNWNDKLSRVATIKAQDIIARGYFDHKNPDGEMVWSEVENSGYNYFTAGENLAIDFNTVGEAYEAWLKSPSHLENIISNKYSDFGFGIATGQFEGRKTNVYVQIFASPEPIYEQILTNIGGSNG